MTKSKVMTVADISNTEARTYYCAGRYCAKREKCHRHTSSTQVNRAPFDDYDLVMIRDMNARSCQYYVSIDKATADINS